MLLHLVFFFLFSCRFISFYFCLHVQQWVLVHVKLLQLLKMLYLRSHVILFRLIRSDLRQSSRSFQILGISQKILLFGIFIFMSLTLRSVLVWFSFEKIVLIRFGVLVICILHPKLLMLHPLHGRNGQKSGSVEGNLENTLYVLPVTQLNMIEVSLLQGKTRIRRCLLQNYRTIRFGFSTFYGEYSQYLHVLCGKLHGNGIYHVIYIQ